MQYIFVCNNFICDLRGFSIWTWSLERIYLLTKKEQDRLWNIIPTINVFAFYVDIEKRYKYYLYATMTINKSLWISEKHILTLFECQHLWIFKNDREFES